MSTASGALLAPSTILSENIFNHFIFKNKELNILKYSRFSVLILAIISFFLAFQNQDIYQLVAGSNALSLVGLFVPLTGGLFFKRFGQKSALASIILGILCWGIAIALNTEVSPLIYGLTGSLIGGIFTMIYTNTTVKDN
jgi:Na+/proline symporter